MYIETERLIIRDFQEDWRDEYYYAILGEEWLVNHNDAVKGVD